ncbi:MAG: serine/threonine-protein phosphatase [Chloroflexi bacterium]|nr:serine/threonine-protein phosphatase [Chloroflexota bacterium]
MSIQTNNYDPRLVGAVTDQGPTRVGNQDALWVPDRATPTGLGALYVVADGVGGQEHGAEAARMVTAVLSDVFYRSRQQGHPVAAALKEAVEQANQAVFDDAASRDAKMGATVVAAVVDAGQVTVAHVGDARAYLVDGRKLRPLTRDDTWVQNQVDAGLLAPEMAEKHEFRNVVTQALGNREEVNVHITQPQSFGPDATLLLCSDGLYDVVTPESLYDLLTQGDAPPAAARALVQAAITAQASDNITAVVVQAALTDSVSPAAAAGRSVPLWLLILIVVVVVAVVAGLFGVWWTTRPSAASGGDDAPVVLPTDSAAEQETAVPSITPLPTATVAATDTPAPTPSPTPEPSATPLPAEPEACIITPGLLFVWPDAAMAAGGCETAVAQYSFVSGDRVMLIGDGPRSLPVPGQCSLADEFVQVQSAADPLVVGWVFLDQVQQLEPGQACPDP